MSLHTMGLLKKAGILYDSSLQARDEPMRCCWKGSRPASSSCRTTRIATTTAI